MIDITSEMIGPADPMALIEEEYADALLRVRFLLEAFRAHDPSNNTAHGRMVYQLRWLERELAARRVPIPLDRRPGRPDAPVNRPSGQNMILGKRSSLK